MIEKQELEEYILKFMEYCNYSASDPFSIYFCREDRHHKEFISKWVESQFKET